MYDERTMIFFVLIISCCYVISAVTLRVVFFNFKGYSICVIVLYLSRWPFIWCLFLFVEQQVSWHMQKYFMRQRIVLAFWKSWQKCYWYLMLRFCWGPTSILWFHSVWNVIFSSNILETTVYIRLNVASTNSWVQQRPSVTTKVFFCCSTLV